MQDGTVVTSPLFTKEGSEPLSRFSVTATPIFDAAYVGAKLSGWVKHEQLDDGAVISSVANDVKYSVVPEAPRERFASRTSGTLVQRLVNVVTRTVPVEERMRIGAKRIELIAPTSYEVLGCKRRPSEEVESLIEVLPTIEEVTVDNFADALTCVWYQSLGNPLGINALRPRMTLDDFDDVTLFSITTQVNRTLKFLDCENDLSGDVVVEDPTGTHVTKGIIDFTSQKSIVELKCSNVTSSTQYLHQTLCYWILAKLSQESWVSSVEELRVFNARMHTLDALSIADIVRDEEFLARYIVEHFQKKPSMVDVLLTDAEQNERTVTRVKEGVTLREI